MRYPDKILSEMLRVGCKGIVNLPNLGHWRIRMQMSLGGRTPLTKQFPHAWYDTPNIHVCTIDDFEVFCLNKAIKIMERNVFGESYSDSLLIRTFPNLFATNALYKLCRNCKDE